MVHIYNSSLLQLYFFFFLPLNVIVYIITCPARRRHGRQKLSIPECNLTGRKVMVNRSRNRHFLYEMSLYCHSIISSTEIAITGRHLAQLVAQAFHVLRLCSRPGFDSWPGSLCCVSLPLSLTLFPVTVSAVLSIKPKRCQKKSIYI